MPGDQSSIRRRTLLTATGGAIALSTFGSTVAGATGGESVEDDRGIFRRCPDATIESSMDDCAGASRGGCADDHPETLALRTAVAETLAEEYPNVGSLIDAGFKPYFDTITGDDDGYSHWLSPDHIGNDRVLAPRRPESVLVDNDSWRSIGVMFLAVRDGEPTEEPPAVYELEEGSEWDERGDTETGGHDGEHDHGGADGRRCAPWHHHVGVPGRFAWWYYRKVYEPDAELELRLPCRTPCMLHVWTVEHPESVYAHDPPPVEYRDRSPAAEAGFDTPAEPGEDELGWDVLPDSIVPDLRPEELRAWFDR